MRVSNQVVQKYWEETRSMIQTCFPSFDVQSIQMPRIEAYRMSDKEFREKEEELSHKPGIKCLDLEEGGFKVTPELSGAFVVSWCDRSKPHEIYLDGEQPSEAWHEELGHIFEVLLGLKAGAITNKFREVRWV